MNPGLWGVMKVIFWAEDILFDKVNLYTDCQVTAFTEFYFPAADCIALNLVTDSICKLVQSCTYANVHLYKYNFSGLVTEVG